MRRSALTVFLALCLLTFIPIHGGCSKNEISMKKPGQDLQMRAVSLRVLQQRLQSWEENTPYPKEYELLAYLTRVNGYIVDKENHDIILLGTCSKEYPPIYLEDFAIALRNVWMEYAELKGNTYWYSNPGCSIDPDPKVMQRLQIIGQDVLSSPSQERNKNTIREWQQTCSSPQTVRVLGIPFDTHFAWVMVKADYDMKKLVDGSDSLNIPGFSSLTDMTLDKAKKDIERGRRLSVPPSSMNRFWFYPGDNRYRDGEGIVLIEESPVILLTEEEYLNHKGEISGRGRGEASAQRFANLFSDKYEEIKKQRPIYTELENLYRFVALAKIMKFKSSSTEADCDLKYLMDRIPVHQVMVNRTLPGRSNVKGFTHRRDYSGGYEVTSLQLPSCGGVNMDLEVERRNFRKDRSRHLMELRSTVLKSRPSPGTFYWDVKGGMKKILSEVPRTPNHRWTAVQRVKTAEG